MCLLALLLLPLPAFAGQWVITYSEDQIESYLVPDYYQPWKTTPQTDHWTTDPATPNYNGNAVGNYWYEFSNVNLSATDAVVATLTWVPAQGQTMQTDPPPAKLTLKQTASAYWQCQWNGSGSPSDAGQADDGLKDPCIFALVPQNPNEGKGTSSGSHLIQVDGSSGVVTLPCTLSAQNPSSTWTTEQNPNDPNNPNDTISTWDWEYDSLV